VSLQPRGLLLVWFDVPAEMDEEFNEWYDTEHVPEREAIPGVLSARRFLAPEDHPRYMAIYDLERPDVLQSAPYLRITGPNESPWTRRIRRKATRLVRNVYEQTSPAPGAGTWITGPHSPSGDLTGPAVLVEMADVPAELEAEFNDWYEHEHVIAELAIRGFRAARRFRVLEGQPLYLAMYELDSVGVPSTAACNLAPRPGRLSELDRILPALRSVRRMVYAQIYPQPKT
jgi:hypothetical protein